MVGELTGPWGELLLLFGSCGEYQLPSCFLFFSPFLSASELLQCSDAIRDVSLFSGQWLTQKLRTEQRAENKYGRSALPQWDIYLYHISSSGVREDHNTTASSRANRSGALMSSQALHKIKIANSTMERKEVPELQALTEEPRADVASGGQGLFSLRCVQFHTQESMGIANWV